MSDIVIKAKGIGKSYLIGHRPNERYVALRDVIVNKAKGLWPKINNPCSHAHKDIEEFWALKDVSFEVKQGEGIGIIGRNGAGKSTLLKILSRITEPTKGRVTIKGRVASLLEIGTGFHPELTGRENIYLNGAILGMTRREIKAKFDEIVDFSGVEKFLDTPVKRFSSGMYVRLAFAVAAHLEPEILVVDEVLAVGDSEFQKKCLGKMRDVATEGRTVLFVSHNIAAIENLCPRTLLLKNGLLALDGNSKHVVEEYEKSIDNISPVPISERKDRMGEGGVKICSVQIMDSNGERIQNIRSGQKVDFIIEFTAESYLRLLEFSLSFKTSMGFTLFYCETKHSCAPFEIRKRQGYVICTIDSFPLDQGSYSFNVTAHRGDVYYDLVREAGTFNVDGGDFFGNGATTEFGYSPFLVKSQWKMKGI